MNSTPKEGHSDAGGLWAVAWRAVFLLPFLFPLGLLWFAMVTAIGALPAAALITLCWREWEKTGILLALWILLLVAYRYFRLGRWFEWPPSVL